MINSVLAIYEVTERTQQAQLRRTWKSKTNADNATSFNSSSNDDRLWDEHEMKMAANRWAPRCAPPKLHSMMPMTIGVVCLSLLLDTSHQCFLTLSLRLLLAQKKRDIPIELVVRSSISTPVLVYHDLHQKQHMQMGIRLLVSMRTRFSNRWSDHIVCLKWNVCHRSLIVNLVHSFLISFVSITRHVCLFFCQHLILFV